jgi:hypothetical protein
MCIAVPAARALLSPAALPRPLSPPAAPVEPAAESGPPLGRRPLAARPSRRACGPARRRARDHRCAAQGGECVFFFAESKCVGRCSGFAGRGCEHFPNIRTTCRLRFRRGRPFLALQGALAQLVPRPAQLCPAVRLGFATPPEQPPILPHPPSLARFTTKKKIKGPKKRK